MVTPATSAELKPAEASKQCEHAKKTGFSQWPAIPASVLLYTLIWPTAVFNAAALFFAVSMFVASMIDEGAFHSLFLPRNDRKGSPFWVRTLNCSVGAVVMVATLSMKDVDDLSAGKCSRELGVIVAGISFLNIAFGMNAAGSSKLFIAVIAPVLFHYAFVFYMTVRLKISMLPLIAGLAALLLYSPGATRDARGNSTTDSQRGVGMSSFSLKMPGHISFTLPQVAYLFLVVIMSFKTSVYELDSIRTGLEVSLSSIHNVSLDSDILTTASEGVLAALNMETRLDVKGWHLLAAGFGVLALTFCRGGKPPKSDANGYTRGAQPGSVARHRLTKIRASRGHFPPPYPNGWFQLCRSDDVPKGEAIAASACNQEFCVFRDGAGVAAVLHAFCPHLGTHLGHGGKVVGGNVVCPYHSWAFDGSGKCANIPYCPKDPTERTNTKAFPSRERCGFIFVWLHADDEQPDYELTLLDEIEEKNMTYVMQVPVENWQMHNMEPSLNSADPYHFNTVHSWLGAKDGKRSLLWVRHECKTRLDMLGHTRENGEPLDKTWIVLDEKVVDARLFGIIPLPKFFNAHYSSGAAFQGPQVSVFRIDSPFLGAMRLVFGFTPEAPFEQRCVCHVFKTPGFPGFLARIFGRLAMATINQDRKVWEHKINVAPKNVVAGDGPFAAYGMWLRRFYSKSSKEFGDLSLEW